MYKRPLICIRDLLKMSSTHRKPRALYLRQYSIRRRPLICIRDPSKNLLSIKYLPRLYIVYILYIENFARENFLYV